MSTQGDQIATSSTLPDYFGLRGFIEQVERIGELRTIHGADWDLEIGAVHNALQTIEEKEKVIAPAVMFDNIKGYPAGYRVMLHHEGISLRRVGIIVRMNLEGLGHQEIVRHLRDVVRKAKHLPAEEVTTAPFFENVLEGDQVDIFRIPVPKWAALDGGRYFGTGAITVTRDPHTGEVNYGVYRNQIHDPQSLGQWVEPEAHARAHRDAWHALGKPCPIAIVSSADPLLHFLGGVKIPEGVDELELAGGLLGRPWPVVRGPRTGLPIPAEAEIVLEGEVRPGDLYPEGPFAEGSDYYSLNNNAKPVIRVTAMYYRNDPIHSGIIDGRPSLRKIYLSSALAWNALERVGVPNVRGVWCDEVGKQGHWTVVSIQQAYAGHPRFAGLATLTLGHSTAHMGKKYAIIVDEDIDPSDKDKVLWAISTRSNPERSIEIIRRCQPYGLDPAVDPREDRDKAYVSKCIIDGCKPWEWRDQFPREKTSFSGDLDVQSQVLEKWGSLLFEGTERKQS